MFEKRVFQAGDVSKPIAEEALQEARDLVHKCSEEEAIWIAADTQITNILDAFIHDPEISYYPLCRTIMEEAHIYGMKVFFYFSGTDIERKNYDDSLQAV